MLTVVNRYSLWKRFEDEVKPDHIKWDHDAGHAYSYIDHPVQRLIDNYDDDWLLEKTNEWLYENDYHNKPPCQIHISKDGSTSSSCGCHDSVIYSQEELDDIVRQLEDHSKKYGVSLDYLVTKEV